MNPPAGRAGKAQITVLKSSFDAFRLRRNLLRMTAISAPLVRLLFGGRRTTFTSLCNFSIYLKTFSATFAFSAVNRLRKTNNI